MTSLSGALLSYLLVYKYFFLFGYIFVSAIALPLPDNLMLLAAGAFASQGYFNFWLVLLTSVVGNSAGDSAGYFFANRYGPGLLHKWRARTPRFVARLERYTREYFGLTVFVTRFFGTVDSIVNVFCGLAQVPYLKFLFYDVLGNVVSLAYVLYIGYLVGGNWRAVSGLVSSIGWIIVVLAAIVGLAIYLGRHRRHVRESA